MAKRQPPKPSKESPPTINTWKAFIDAQEIMTNQYSAPFEVAFTKIDKESNLHFTLVENNFYISILQHIKTAFPKIKDTQINFEKKFFQYNLADEIDDKAQAKLESYAAANYFDFLPKPCITGSVSLRQSPYQKISKRLLRFR